MFRRRFEKEILLHAAKKNSGPVAVLLSNCGFFGFEVFTARDQLTIIHSNPNCTFPHQPFILGNIAEWKRIYKKHMMVETNQNIENNRATRNKYETNPAGMNGMAKGCDHMLGVT